MRNLGIIMLMGGILAFFYCTSQLSSLGPAPSDLSLAGYLRDASGRMELGQYVAGFAVAVGAILTLFPRGR